jgi:hypothetical protein
MYLDCNFDFLIPTSPLDIDCSLFVYVVRRRNVDNFLTGHKLVVERDQTCEVVGLQRLDVAELEIPAHRMSAGLRTPVHPG